MAHTTNWKDMEDPIRGTLLPIFYIIYFGQDIPHGSILSNNEKMKLAKMGPGYCLWVTTVSDAIENREEINVVIDAYSAAAGLILNDFYKKHFYGLYDRKTSLPILGTLFRTITTVQSIAYPVEVNAIKKIVSLCSKRYYRLRLRHRPLPFSSSPRMLRKRWLPGAASTS